MKRWAWLIPVLLAIVVYSPSLWAELVWDDNVIINRQIVVFKSLEDVFFPPNHIPQWAASYYRPVIVLTYLLDQRLFGANATVGPHLTNIIFHTLITFFVWLFATQCLRSLPNSYWGAVLAASIFAVHPIHTESVSWITGRSDTVAALFMMASVVVALYYRSRGVWWALALAPLLFLLAVLCKEVALSTLLVLPVILLLAPKGRPRLQHASLAPHARGNQQRSQKGTSGPSQPLGKEPQEGGQTLRWCLTLGALYMAATLIYFLLRQHAHVAYGRSLNVGLSELLLRAWRATAYYLLKTVVPAPQLHFVALENLPSALQSTLILFVATAAVGIGVWLWRRGAPLILISVAWFVCTISPSLVIAVKKISENPVAERYLYLPSVALGLLLGSLMCVGIERCRLRVFVIGLAVLTIGGYAVGTVRRGMVWTDNIKLWTDASEKAPNQGLPWTELGHAYIQHKKFDEALTSFHRAIKSNYDQEGRSIAHNNIAMVHLRRGQLDEAESHFHAAIQERQGYPTPHYGLGLVALERTRRIKSIEFIREQTEYAAEQFEVAIQLNPNYTKALWGLIRCQMLMGSLAEKAGDVGLAVKEYRTALGTFERLLQIDPHFVSVHPMQAQSVEKIRTQLKLLIGGS